MKIDRWKVVALIALVAFIGAVAWFVAGGQLEPKADRRAAEESTSPEPHGPAVSTSPSPAVSLLTSNPSRALNDALQDSDPRKRSVQFGRVLVEWLKTDPEGALAYVAKMPHGAEYTGALFMVLSTLGETDPRRAVVLAGEMATTGEEQAIYSALFERITRGDIPTALSFLELVPEGESRDNALRAIAVSWADQDVVAALDWAKGISNPDEHAAAVEATLIIRAKRDGRRTIDLALELLTGDPLERTLAEAMRHLTATDPKGASEMVARLPEGMVKTHATLGVVRALAAEQPETALSWVKSLPPGQLQQQALNNILDFWSARDPQNAAEYVGQMPKGSDQDAAARYLAKSLGASDPAHALRWSQTLEGSARTAALVSLASGWAQKDPAAATQWAATLPSDNPARPDAIKDALSYWVLRDGNAARKFAATLPPEDRTKAGLREE